MELIRRFLRGRLGGRSVLYQYASRLYSRVAITYREGPLMAGILNRIARAPQGQMELVKFKNLAHPFFLRPGTHDVATAINTFVRSEYGQINKNWQPKTLVDAGAYIGDTSAYFLSRFPELNVLALEPNPENFAVAKRNLAPYGSRVAVLPFALSSNEGSVHFSGGGTGGSISDDGITVTATSIPQILERIPGQRISLLKLDIEGAEETLFSTAPERWLTSVDRIIVELHGPRIIKSVLNVLAQHHWAVRPYRSVWYCAAPGLRV